MFSCFLLSTKVVRPQTSSPEPRLSRSFNCHWLISGNDKIKLIYSFYLKFYTLRTQVSRIVQPRFSMVGRQVHGRLRNARWLHTYQHDQSLLPPTCTCSAGLSASFLKGQGHQCIFSFVKGTLWGNCIFLLKHFKGTKAIPRRHRGKPSLPLWRSRHVVSPNVTLAAHVRSVHKLQLVMLMLVDFCSKLPCNFIH